MAEFNPEFSRPTPPRSPCPPRSPTPRSPVTKTRSVALDSNSPRVSVERFLSVDQSPKGRLSRRRSGSGLQDLSGNVSSSDTSKPSKGKSLLTDLLNPIKTYARRKSHSSRDSSSSNLSSSDEAEGDVSRNRHRPENPALKLLGDDADMNRRGSLNAFLSIISKGTRNSKSLNVSRRNSIDSNDGFSPRKIKNKSSRKGMDKRKNSLEVAKSRKAADEMRDLYSKKPDCFETPIHPSNSGRKDSLDVIKDRNRKTSESKSANQSPVTQKKEGKDRRHSEASNVRNRTSKEKSKVRKKKSLGETLSLKIPVSSIRRNSIDAFSLRSLFSSSRKNSEEEIKVSSKQKEDNLLKVSQLNATKRRHSHGSADSSTESAYIYRPVSRPRNRLNSLNLYSRYSESPSSRSRARTPSIVVTNSSDEYSRADSRRSSGGVSVVLSPSSSSASGSDFSDDEPYSSADEGSSCSMSHSSITSLDSEASMSSANFHHQRPSRYHRARPQKIIVTDRRYSSSSRASSAASDDVFDNSASGSEKSEGEEDEPIGGRGGGFWESLQAQPPPLDIAASSDEDFYNLYDDYLFEGEVRVNSGVSVLRFQVRPVNEFQCDLLNGHAEMFTLSITFVVWTLTLQNL